MSCDTVLSIFRFAAQFCVHWCKWSGFCAEFDVWFAGYSYVESPSFCATVSMALCDIKIVKCLVTICDVHERINDVPTVHIC